MENRSLSLRYYLCIVYLLECHKHYLSNSCGSRRSHESKAFDPDGEVCEVGHERGGVV